MYLGANIVKTEVIDDSGNKFPCWGISSSNYTKAIAEVERILDSEEYGHVYLPKKKISTPLQSGYRPELDPTPLMEWTVIKCSCHEWEFTNCLLDMLDFLWSNCI